MRFFHRGRFTRGRTKWRIGYFWAEHESNVQMKLQPEQTLSIFPYRAEFKDDFFELNAEWLEAYFLIEPYDLEVLRNPQEMILDEGGEIYVGAIDGDVVATFALTPRQEGVMELNKMAVRKDQRGAGIGNQLMDYVIARCRDRGVRTLELYSNTKLENALHSVSEIWDFEKYQCPQIVCTIVPTFACNWFCE